MTVPAPVVRAGATSLLTTAHDATIEYLVVDSPPGPGGRTTIFVPGFGGDIATTRPLASGVAGRRVFPLLRGHGRSSAAPGRWRYADLAADVRAVADAVGADQALGVSLGAGALCHLAATEPNRFERLVFFLPAVLDTPRPAASRQRLRQLVTAAGVSDDALAAALAAEIPVEMRDTAAARAYLTGRVAALRRDGLASSLAALADDVAVRSRDVLRAVAAPALVLACRGDAHHPVEVAEQLADVLPAARLHVFDGPDVLWTRRAELRDRIATFLNDATGTGTTAG